MFKNFLLAVSLMLLITTSAYAEDVESREGTSILPGVDSVGESTAWEFGGWTEAGSSLFSVNGEEDDSQLFTNSLAIMAAPTAGPDDDFFGFLPTAIRTSVMTIGDLERITTQTVFGLGISDSYAGQLKRCEWLSADAMMGAIYFVPIAIDIDGVKYKPIAVDTAFGDNGAYSASITGWVPIPLTSHPLNYTAVFDITKSGDQFTEDWGGFAEIRHRLDPDGSTHVSVGYANHLETDMVYLAFGSQF